MIIVSDTSPLNYLVLIGHVEVLPILFDRVVAPPAATSELQHPKTPQLVCSWATSTPPWLEIVPPTSIDPALKLGAGETAAISLAVELAADLLLIDERKATSIAEQLGFRVVGTLNVLALAAERKLVDLPSAVAALRQTTFREPTELVKELLGRDSQHRMQE